MNKDVVYIEPEDDITDIITKIENSKEKIVALVPPKKAAVLRSIVNIKLIAKAGANAGRTVVLVTTDPSIVKLAATVKLPVTKSLQSAPEVPELAEEVEEASSEEVDENAATESDSSEVSDEEPVEEGLEEEGLRDDSDASQDENEVDEEPKKAQKAEKSAISGEKSKFPSKIWFREHKKLCIGVSAGVAALILLFVWMFAIAPSATISIGVRTTTSNFSENVTFTSVLTDEDAENGKFYLTEAKNESKSTVEFEATGKKNMGEKATGEITVYAFLPKRGGSTSVNKGSTFSNNGLSYVATEDVVLSWSGNTLTECENYDDLSIMDGCYKSQKVAVEAADRGTAYNIAATTSGWTVGSGNVLVRSSTAMTGGTDDFVTVVQQSDIDKAKTELKTTGETEAREKLVDSITNEDAFIVTSSFARTEGEAVSNPKVGEAVEDGKKATLTVTTTDTIFYIDKTKVEEFISAKAKLANNFKIYSMNDPFVENFTKTDSGYTGKLKASYVAGPAVTENDVIEIAKGKGTGTATHDLSGIDGIGTVTITTPFPWVTSVPSDPNRITVIIDYGD